MKKITFTFIVLSIISHCKAQDVITKNDSSKTSASILEINPNEIKYKLFNYNDGPTISIIKTDVAYIRFKNGTVDRFTKPEIISTTDINYNPNRYNLSSVSVSRYNTPEEKIKKCEKLYAKKNYFGFNYIAFLNTALGFNYMRDVKKANLIINIPFAFGLGSPAITNSLYGYEYLDGVSTTKYELMKYQIGINTLFAPSMNREVNFLMGPFYNLSEYRMSVDTKYTTVNATQNQYNDGRFTNSFRLRRQHFGINIGMLARFSEKINMNMLITFGYKQDSYDEADPFGIEKINKDTKNQMKPKDNVMPYVNFAWSIGYRF